MSIKSSRYQIVLWICAFQILGGASYAQTDQSVKRVMDRVIEHLYQTRTPQELTKLNQEQVVALFSKNDMEILSTQHWRFTANVPVVVSVMRSVKQKDVPFWLIPSGFQKTTLTMRNEKTTYEVWQKAFPAGEVGLGINGFENEMLHYFVSVAPQQKGDSVKLSNFFPEKQYVGLLQNGAFVYHDWDELVLMDVPETMRGEQYLTTIRGRGEESHLIGAFRSTAYPASKNPDQVMLTWSGDPKTTIDIQWRTDSTVMHGAVRFREKGGAKLITLPATRLLLEDRMLMNGRYISRFTAQLKGLKPGTKYEYLIEPQQEWQAEQSFTTAGSGNSFSFLWFGDTHHSPKFGEILQQAVQDHPDAAFCSIAGDQVSDGLQRDQWDDLFAFSQGVVSHMPMMSVLGNHDNRSGLGASMYQALFSYPLNGPAGIPPEHTYAFTYKNALFLMIDATSPIEAQNKWIEAQLAHSKATWKFAMFHFAPYNWEEPYYNIQKAWVPIFDKYHVDMVMSGHLHYYMRSKPMYGGKMVDSYKKGTAYLISVAIPGHADRMTAEPYAEVRDPHGFLYQYMQIDGRKLSFVSVKGDHQVLDSFVLEK